MIFTDGVADDAGRLFIRLVISIAELVHRPEHAAVDGFEPVAHVGKGAPDDHGHCVIEIRSPHLVFDIYLIAF